MDAMGFTFSIWRAMDDTKIAPSIEKEAVVGSHWLPNPQNSGPRKHTYSYCKRRKLMKRLPQFWLQPTILHVKLRPRAAGQNNLVKLQFGTHSSHVQYGHILKYVDMT